MSTVGKIRKIAIALSVLSLILVGLGGFVRATGAGLSCPDWPLCFGKMVPEFAIAGVPQEVIHRYIAGIVSLLTVLLAVETFRSRKAYPRLWKTSVVLLVLLGAQVVMGGLTVLMDLNPFIVTGHLLLGTLFLLIVSLIAIEREHPAAIEKKERQSAAVFTNTILVLTVLMVAQIVLGGFVGSSGLSLICPDIPWCQGQVIPDNTPQGIHMLHRALGVLIFLGMIAAIVMQRRTPGMAQKRKGHLMGVSFLVFVQVNLGIMNVAMLIPISVAVIHLVVAELILLGLASLYKELTPSLRVYQRSEDSDQISGEQAASEQSRRVVGS